MNEPIISPWVFYLLSVTDNLRAASFGAVLLMLIALVLAPAWTDGFTACVKYFKGILIAFIVSVTFLIFVPSSDVIIKMTIAQHITAKNVEKAGNLTEKAVDKIIEKVVKAAQELRSDKK